MNAPELWKRELSDGGIEPSTVFQSVFDHIRRHESVQQPNERVLVCILYVCMYAHEIDDRLGVCVCMWHLQRRHGQ